MKKKGFTLIELLVVIAIIGMLTSIVLVSMGGARKKGRDAQRQATIRQISSAMELCYDDSSCGGAAERYPTWASRTSLEGNTIGTYLTVPTDNIYDYYAAANTDPQKYCIYIQLESGGWSCASNKGIATVSSGSEPTISSCCGMTP